MKKKSWMTIVFSFASQCKVKMMMSVICAVISVLGGLIPYISVYKIINLFLEGNKQVSNILFWIGICLMGYLGKVLFYAISTTLSHTSAYTILENMRLSIADRLMKAPLGTVINESVGKLKSIIIDRVETIEVPLAHLIPEGISNLLIPISVFVYLLCINWKMALASMITVPIAMVAYAKMMGDYSKKYNDYMEASNYVNSVIIEYTEGIEVIKAFNQSSSSYEKFSNAITSFKEYTLDWFKSTWKLMNFGSAVLPSTLLGTMPIGMHLYLNGGITPSDLTICLILSLGIVAPLMSFTAFVNQAKSIEYAVRDVEYLLNLPTLKNETIPVKLEKYNIELSNVSFSYDEDGKKILDGISCSIPENKFTALVGPSGGGKSTIARLISRFWDVTGGSITVGGVDVRKIPLTQLADYISFVTQDNFLFNCSLKENIRLGNPKATDEEVYRAAKLAQCDEFVLRLEKGYDTTAGEAGGKLSGGEKQRIAIARAILKNAPIVILDEATAFTDPENEAKLQKSISELTKGKTLLVIAHRLSTIKNADKIIVLKNGNVVKTGTHNELLENCPLYLDMWEAHIGAKKWAANVSSEGGLSAC